MTCCIRAKVVRLLIYFHYQRRNQVLLICVTKYLYFYLSLTSCYLIRWHWVWWLLSWRQVTVSGAGSCGVSRAAGPSASSVALIGCSAQWISANEESVAVVSVIPPIWFSFSCVIISKVCLPADVWFHFLIDGYWRLPPGGVEIQRSASHCLVLKHLVAYVRTYIRVVSRLCNVYLVWECHLWTRLMMKQHKVLCYTLIQLHTHLHTPASSHFNEWNQNFSFLVKKLKLPTMHCSTPTTSSSVGTVSTFCHGLSSVIIPTARVTIMICVCWRESWTSGVTSRSRSSWYDEAEYYVQFVSHPNTKTLHKEGRYVRPGPSSVSLHVVGLCWRWWQPDRLPAAPPAGPRDIPSPDGIMNLSSS